MAASLLAAFLLPSIALAAAPFPAAAFLLPSIALAAAPFPALTPFRPPATPLLVRSPFHSFYAAADSLNERDTQLWSGARAAFSGLLRVDGAAYTFLGAPSPAAPAAPQLAPALVSATRSQATFRAGGVQLVATFGSPMLPPDGSAAAWAALSTPASYIELSAAALDGAAHAVELYLDVDASILTNESSTTTPVSWRRVSAEVPGAPVLALSLGAAAQWPLNPVVCGQSVPLTASQTIVWGHAYLLADAEADVEGSVGRTALARAAFAANGSLPADDPSPPRAVGDGFPGAALAWALALPAGSATAIAKRATFFLDEILAASFYDGVAGWEGNDAAGVFAPLWRSSLPFNDTVGVPGAALAAAHASAVALDAASSALDADVFSRLLAAGGSALASYGSLIYRQVLGAFTLIFHPARRETWAFFKEIASGGDFSTVDVLYPSSPLFLSISPALLKAALLPLLVYSSNASINHKAWVMHDLGKFPIAARKWDGQEDMPLEETGNVFHMLAAIAMLEGGNVSWMEEFFDAPGGIIRWRDFIYASLPVVPPQGTTDDFLGVAKNNTNAGIKGAVGLAAYGYLAYQHGDMSNATEAWTYAACAAAVNVRRGFYIDAVAAGGVNESHWCWGWNYCSEEGTLPPASTFLQYNFGYAALLRFTTLFPSQPDLMAQQAAYYARHTEGKYGVGLSA